MLFRSISLPTPKPLLVKSGAGSAFDLARISQLPVADGCNRPTWFYVPTGLEMRTAARNSMKSVNYRASAGRFTGWLEILLRLQGVSLCTGFATELRLSWRLWPCSQHRWESRSARRGRIGCAGQTAGIESI